MIGVCQSCRKPISVPFSDHVRESAECGRATFPVEIREALKAPFPWFGGKSRVADVVWDRFGDVANYVEPFFGSGAVLLGRPHAPKTETVNDLDCYLANFWRALQQDPEAVARWADWPVNEADLHARHLWLVNQTDFRERMKTDPDFYDAKVAGFWVWGISQWIGSGWCPRPEWSGLINAAGKERGIHAKRPVIDPNNGGRGVHKTSLQIPRLSADQGINSRLPHPGDAGMGINRTEEKRPHLSGRGPGVGVNAERAAGLIQYFEALADRLRRVRVCCGAWSRVMGPSVTIKHGICGVFLDPPYADFGDTLYAVNETGLSAAVREWAIANGDNPLLRIALCGYEGEHEMPPEWECYAWKNRGGYGSQGGRGAENAHRERIWFSPHCLNGLGPLFAGVNR